MNAFLVVAAAGAANALIDSSPRRLLSASGSHPTHDAPTAIAGKRSSASRGASI
ncbi:hypothetical protein [Nocardioides sp. Leaf285]|uniref:hypothetical protein n=1 Tax=Nocardioides sp. Leaf285 TaxID=1736322 RepID=UPI000A55EF8D|nr:hypothetical protein [Nocardioides sp. Leaf285]